MNETASDNDGGLAALKELFASATHDASAAMCRWTDGVISVTLDSVRRSALEEVGAELASGGQLLTMIVMTLEGPLGGTLILMFDEFNGRQLAASLVRGAPRVECPWTEMEKSALMETGNILGCAYLNALTRLIGTDLVPSAPCFVEDFGASVLEQAIVVQAAAGDRVLLCEVAFRRLGTRLDWRVVFVPTPGLEKALEQSLHAAL